MLQCQLGGNTLQSWGNVLQDAVYALNQYPIYRTISTIVRIHRSRNQRVEIGLTLLTITPSEPPAKILLPIRATLDSANLEFFIPKGGKLPPGDTTSPLNWKLRPNLLVSFICHLC